MVRHAPFLHNELTWVCMCIRPNARTGFISFFKLSLVTHNVASLSLSQSLTLSLSLVALLQGSLVQEVRQQWSSWAYQVRSSSLVHSLSS